MSDNLLETNKVTLIGDLVSDFEYSHTIFGEVFYKVKIEVPRLSDNIDQLPVIISERLLVDQSFGLGDQVTIKGQLRSYNRKVDERSKLILVIFAKDIVLTDEDSPDRSNPNSIFLNGFICKPTIYRETPFGREICDILLAVNRMYNKSDYIPCITWGRNARYAKNLEIGDRINIWGRIQSRNYEKKLVGGDIQEKVAYEVSISKLIKEEPSEMKECPDET
ncbi:single-stranded DNA-binding protein [Alkalibaculum sp. M08DMB]|uniref:Single-stranded DNA-binding protein n=1 Tax=Alkalibaculum sporogenes TaxID=2655001 RepID=A0A6A7K654_9FIRM|nr:single-stranded DNA-binding protein [Alkalibaculum sporogenes]MPW24697.1 single-stranded DNA-binding protein [Alkalibaculum sporogenes]